MGLFGKRKKLEVEETVYESSTLSSEIISFLREADVAYIGAYETRNMSLLKEYFNRDAIIKLGVLIRNTAGTRYFANEKFRTTSWTLMEDYGDSIVVEKSVVFSVIRVAGSTKIKISQDYTEYWTIEITEDEILVSDIRMEG